MYQMQAVSHKHFSGI